MLAKGFAVIAIALASVGTSLSAPAADYWWPEISEGRDDPVCRAFLKVVREGFRSNIYDLDLESLPWQEDGTEGFEELAWTEVVDRRVDSSAYQGRGPYYIIDLGTLGIGRSGHLADVSWSVNGLAEGYTAHFATDRTELEELITGMYPAENSPAARAEIQRIEGQAVYISYGRNAPVLKYAGRLFIFERNSSQGLYDHRTGIDRLRYVLRELAPNGALGDSCTVEARPSMDHWRAMPRSTPFVPDVEQPWNATPYITAVVESGPLGPFLTRLGNIVRDEGEGRGGTMNVWLGRILHNQDAVVRAHNRPWAFQDPQAWWRQDDDGSEGKLGFLRAWGLRGAWEYRQQRAFEAIWANSFPLLSRWYQDRFGFSPVDANRLAEDVLKGLLRIFLSGGGHAPGFTHQGFVETNKPSRGDPANGPWQGPYFIDFERCAGQYLRALTLAGAPIEELEILIETGGAQGQSGGGGFCGTLEAYDPLLSYALDRPDVLELLLSRGAQVDARSHAGKTALMIASHLDKPEAARRLIEAGADVNAVTASKFGLYDTKTAYRVRFRQRSALMYAAENASVEMVTLLLVAGADPHMEDSGGRGVPDYLARNGKIDAAARDEIREMLVEAMGRD